MWTAGNNGAGKLRWFVCEDLATGGTRFIRTIDGRLRRYASREAAKATADLLNSIPNTRFVEYCRINGTLPAGPGRLEPRHPVPDRVGRFWTLWNDKMVRIFHSVYPNMFCPSGGGVALTDEGQVAYDKWLARLPTGFNIDPLWTFNIGPEGIHRMKYSDLSKPGVYLLRSGSNSMFCGFSSREEAERFRVVLHDWPEWGAKKF